MYAKHFRLTRRPFPAVVDAALYYPATGQELALRALVEALQDQEAFALLTGEPGTGKSLVAQRLLRQLGRDVVTAWITNTHCADAAALFQALLYDLDQPYEGASEQELRLRLTDHLLRLYKDKKRTVLVIDEAQNLTPFHLEELRLLSNLETRNGRAVQLVLIGLPASADILRRRELAGLAQRVAVRAQLTGLDVHEAADYLLHHLRAAGGQPERIITDEALETLARGARGIPRLLNQATHRAFHLACVADVPQVDVEASLEALIELGLAPETEESGESTAREEHALAPLLNPNRQVLHLEADAARPEPAVAAPRRPA